MMKKILTIIVVSSMLTGCSFIPGYSRPRSPVSSQWPVSADPSAGKVAEADIGWRTFFADPRLQRIIELALTNNRDLRVALLNVEQTRAVYRVDETYLLPAITGGANGLRKIDISSNGEGVSSGKYSLDLGITSYEIDIFGGLRSLKKQALEDLFATEETRKSVQITVVAQVAIQYLMERALDEQSIEAQQTLVAVESYHHLIQSRYDAGNATALDLHSAEAQVEEAKATVAGYAREKAQATNGLVALVGQDLPNDLPEPLPLAEQPLLIEVPADLPSDLLNNRPDILAAEHALRKANANIGAARAAFFPRLMLTTSAGIASVKLTDLFTGGSVWSFAPQITVPIFNWGGNKANLDVAKIGKNIQIAKYEKSIQTAFREVADALVARATYIDQIDAQQALVTAQRQRYQIADVRYRSGVDNYLTVLLAQQDLFTARRSLIQSQFAQLSNAISLYKALGGGWKSK